MLIRRGSCIGILYRPPKGQCKADQCQTYSGSCHCVHNGRRPVGAVTKLDNTQIHISRTLNTSTLKSLAGVLFRHWNIGNPNDKDSIFLEYLFIPASRLESIKVTPFKNLDKVITTISLPLRQSYGGIHKAPFRVPFSIMETRGVEPLSEDNATSASTGVVTVLMSLERTPRNRLSLKSA